MSRINVLIADNDEFYIDGLCKYLLEKYSDRLNISAFTDKSLLQAYLEDNSSKTDMLLLGTDMLLEGMEANNLICLTERKNKENYNINIFKYQSADNIAYQIFDIFSKLSDKEFTVMSGDHKCTITAVYSPVGGVGKSTVAAALCKCLNKRNQKAFYLNLETAPSTLSLFNTCSVYNLSNVLYGIKERSKNLSLKIEAAISVDSASGVSFFAPGESPLEIEEMQSEEIVSLIDQLKATGRFDYIVIDMSSALNTVNIDILKESNTIITVSGKGSISQSKINSFRQVIEIINKRESISLSEKNILLINRNRTNDSGSVPEGMANFVFSMPDLTEADDDSKTNALSCCMDDLVSRLCSREKAYD